MSKFAKLFDSKYGQILVVYRTNDDDKPAFTFTACIGGCMVDYSLVFDESKFTSEQWEEMQAELEQGIEKVTEEEAIEMIDALIAENPILKRMSSHDRIATD